ncbi:MAG: YwbE family protein [Spirochaetales bacterium]|nr:YwbE family protein [Spirochaetales bacterium]
MAVPTRRELSSGVRVRIVLKQDQRTGRLTEGAVKDILTKSPTHPHGIKVRLQDGQVGRVQEIVES